LEIVMISVLVNDESQVAEARREVTAIARQQGFNEVHVGRAALVTTELATNLIKHARGGEILVGPDEGAGKNGIQVLALDKGRGMANVQACLADGYSSAGTAGHGLGAVIRQSTFSTSPHGRRLVPPSWPELSPAKPMRRAKPPTPASAQCRSQNRGRTSAVMPGRSTTGDLRPHCSWLMD
jgi:anti-sigma regulatory factor (Ser/Thr protein kinase)